MPRLTVNQWNALWCRGACWQSMDKGEVEIFAEMRLGYTICEVYADGFPSMYGAAPSGWIQEAVNV